MGNELAKVLWYYNLLPSTSEAVQKIVCPFHEDVNPSMLVDIKENRWYCFGCNKSGDAKKFVSTIEWKYHQLNDLESLSMYHKILKSKKTNGIKISRSVKSHRKPSKRLAYDMAYDYYHGLSKVDWREDSEIVEVSEARTYMINRGFTEEVLNICKAKITYNNSYGIIFPMLDNGKFKGWVCRTMIKEIEAKRKYLYNEGFSRATTLVGNYGNKKYVLICEGFMDRLKFVQYGIEADNIVAILGWKITDEQLNKLKSKGITDVISCLDNDECGKRGTKYLRTEFNVTRFQYIKGIKDPGEMTEDNIKKCYRRTMKKYRDMKV